MKVTMSQPSVSHPNPGCLFHLLDHVRTDDGRCGVVVHSDFDNVIVKCDVNPSLPDLDLATFPQFTARLTLLSHPATPNPPASLEDLEGRLAELNCDWDDVEYQIEELLSKKLSIENEMDEVENLISAWRSILQARQHTHAMIARLQSRLPV